ncbi:hypothetical protein CLAUR_040620 [Clostridium felsineum]|nr:hypothetical protein CLAUR_040620 [Clostridium felsineum]
MNYFSDEFKSFLAEYHVFDAWQFLLKCAQHGRQLGGESPLWTW